MISALLGGGEKKAQTPALLETQITIQRSVVHKCAQADIQLLNECLGIADHPEAPKIADEYLKTADGEALIRSLKGYIMFATGRTI